MRLVLSLALAAFAALPAAAQVASMSASSKMDERGAILIRKINIPGDGFIVVRSASGGRPLAVAAVKAGVTSDLRLPLSRPARAGERFDISVHADYGVKGKFEPNADPAALSAGIVAP